MLRISKMKGVDTFLRSAQGLKAAKGLLEMGRYWASPLTLGGGEAWYSYLTYLNEKSKGKSMASSINSALWFFPGNTKRGFQIDCGLRIQGGDYIRHNYIPHSKAPTGKYSFRLYFRGSYGAGRLKYPFFPGLPVEEFEHIVLRAGMNDPINPFIVDELIRRLNTDMGQASSQGTIVNLYLNGKYQGYYNPVERIDSNFLRSRHGVEPNGM